MEPPANSQAIVRYDAIFLSPHLDDAVLSCGGTINQITKNGGRVLVASVMAGDLQGGVLSPFAKSLHRRWEIDSPDAASRREEDIGACLVLEASWHHCDIPDCIYRQDHRTGIPLYTTEESLFGPVNPEEKELAARIADIMAGLPDAEQVFAPLGVGNHVDHQLTRLAAERWIEPESLIYYEEYPYAESVEGIYPPFEYGNRWHRMIRSMAEDDLLAKTQAAACYRSQISTFFDSEEEMADRIMSYQERIGGEPYWKLRR